MSTDQSHVSPESAIPGFTETDDLPADTSTPGIVSAGSPGYGSLLSPYGQDWFRVEVVAGTSYGFYLYGNDDRPKPLDDPYLRLFDGTGSLIAENDDWDGLDSYIGHTAEETGTLYLGAGGYAGNTGAYVLSLGPVLPAATEGDDVLEGTPGPDYIYGFGGNDTIYGYQGGDDLHGDDGSDLIFGNAGNDYIDGGRQWDTLHGGLGDDTVNGGLGSDLARLGEGDDVYWDMAQGGIHGRDTVHGEDGNDYIETGGGDDLILGGAGNDEIWAGAGNDSIQGGLNSDTIEAGSGDDTVRSGKGRDEVHLGNGRDIFWDSAQGGASGADYIDGGNGSDTLYIGGGYNTVMGGNGPDVFVFLADNIGDEVLDYQDGVDRIDISAWGITSIDQLGFASIAGGGVEFSPAGFANESVHLSGDIHAISIGDLDPGDFIFAAT